MKKLQHGILPNSERVLNVFTELLALQWIKKNTPELQGVQIAMREVEASNKCSVVEPVDCLSKGLEHVKIGGIDAIKEAAYIDKFF